MTFNFKGYIIYNEDRCFLKHSYSGWEYTLSMHTAKLYKNKKSAEKRAESENGKVYPIELIVDLR
jgi:hypothetical protein